jgi:hypothetical protein
LKKDNGRIRAHYLLYWLGFESRGPCYDFVVLIHEKKLTSEEPKFRLARLSSRDLDAVYAFECSAWPEPLQASYQTLATRFELNHFMFGAWEQEQLIGLVSWRHAWFDPEDRSIFPKSFTEFSGAPNSNPHNAVFVYNFGIHPARRGMLVTQALIASIIAYIKSGHCKYLVGDGRCPSYNGSNTTTEQVTPSKIFKAALDRQLKYGQEPSLQEYLADPLLRFYYRRLGCQFFGAVPNFLPTDSASGGHQVIFYKAL